MSLPIDHVVPPSATAAAPAEPASTRADAAPDADLVAALRAGDERAFLALVERYQRPLVRLASAFVPSRAVAEEVVQETWIAVVRGIGGFEGRASLRTWLFRICTFQAKTRGQRERRSVPFSTLAETEASGFEPAVTPSRFIEGDDPWRGHWADRPDPWGDGERRVLERETQEVVARALEALPPAQRLVMTLRDVEGWTSDEVCDSLEISAGNQRVLLHRARSKVRGALEAYFRAPTEMVEGSV